MSTDEAGRAVAWWDAAAENRKAAGWRGWLDHPVVAERTLSACIGTNPTRNWLHSVVDEYSIPRTASWLSIGCGVAELELATRRYGLAGSILAVDFSRSALEIARAAAVERGIDRVEFQQLDVERDELPAGPFDVVLFNMSLHHVRRLRRVLAKASAALAPDGWLVLNEYLGPRRFQFSRERVAIVERLLATLPESKRIDVTTGQVKHSYEVRTVGWWKQTDPSESVRSDRIANEVGRRFEIAGRHDYGGAILHLVLEHIVHNFDPNVAPDVALLNHLIQAERDLERSGAIPSDFAVIVARPGSEDRRGPAARFRKLLADARLRFSGERARRS